MPQVIPQLINGQWQASNARELIEVTDPATQEVLALAPKATHEDIEAAIAGAKQAFFSWREVPVPERARLMLRYQTPIGTRVEETAAVGQRILEVALAEAGPENVPVYNYAFDVTPAELIAGIITERGVLTAPYVESIRAVIGGK